MNAGECTILVTDRWDTVAEAWRELERDGACHAFQTLVWVSTAIDTIGRARNCEPKIVLVRDAGGQAQMLIPLAVRRHRGLRILEFVDFKVSDYNAPLIRREFADALRVGGFADLWSRILVAVGPVDALHLEKMPAEIDGAPNPFVQLKCAATERAHLAAIDGDARRYLDTRSKSALSGLRRKRRGLAKLGAVSFATAGSTEEADRLVRLMIDWKSRRYRSTGVPDLFDDPSYAEFYRALARKGWDDLIHLSVLALDGEPVSVALGTRFRQRLCFLMPVFDLGERSRFSPGHLHILDVVDWCAAHGQEILDFTWGDEAYKATWATETLPLYETCQGRTLVGQAWSRGLLFRKAAYRTVKQRVSRHPDMLAKAKEWRRRLRDAARTATGKGRGGRAEPSTRAGDALP